MNCPDETLPLLPLQQGMVLHLFADPNSGTDIQQCIVRVREPLRMDAFTGAWQRVAARHDGLRTLFRLESARCTQQILRVIEVVTTRVDWSTRSEIERDAAFEEFLYQDRKRGIDVGHAPNWRVTAFDCGAEGFRFVFTKPHAILDATSVFIILRELFTFYTAGRDGVVLPRAGSFRDYMEWHAQRDTAAAERCWRNVFQNFEGPADLQIGHPTVAVRGQGTAELLFDAALSERIRDAAKRADIPLSEVVKAAWAVLLSRLSSADDVVFGEVRSGRRKEVPDMATTLGMFVTTVPARAHVTADKSLRTLALELRAFQQDIRDHEQTPLTDIQKWCGLPAGRALFDSALVFDHVSVGAIMQRDGSEWLGREISYREQTSVPITLNVTAEPQFVAKVSYDRTRFPDSVMRRIPQWLRAVLESFAENPDCIASRIDILTDEERTLLRSWNDTARDFDSAATIPLAFNRCAQTHPNRCALVFGDDELTYAQLATATARVAAVLRAHGVRTGSVVGICAERSIEMVVALLASMQAGAAYVPLDPGFPDERLRLMVEDARPIVIVADRRHVARLQSPGTSVICTEDLQAMSTSDSKSQQVEAADLASSDLAYVLYTSGSTGRPKGVMVTHRNVANCLTGMDDVLPQMPAGRWLAVTSISFDISVIELFWTLTRGHAVVLSRSSSDVFELADLLKNQRITHFQCTPSLARMLAMDADARASVRNLPVILLGGEALPADLLRQVRGGDAQHLINVYGPTETTVWSTATRVSDDITIGRPIANTQLYVLDSHGMPVPVGIAGELYIGGEGVTRGYLNRPELTAERFVTDPLSSGARLYRTGDQVRYREDGRLDYLGRLDHQVKILGHRIEVGEIEKALTQLPGIGNAAVVARDVAGNSKRLVAYVTPSSNGPSPPAAELLQKALLATLPDYAVPTAYVVLDKLPLTPNLKIDRKALPDPAQSAATADPASAPPPRNNLERRIARLWCEVLALEKVSVKDNFFSLGGDSLKVVQLVLGMREQLHVEISPNTVHQQPTIEALAAALAAGGGPPCAWAVWEQHGFGHTPTPIIGLHGVDDIFVPLAGQLGLPLHTLTSRVGFDGSVAPYHPATTVEEMAERYLAELTKVRPKGPYVLMGFCLGALIALEVANRLVAAGETVEFLGLFNPPPPQAPPETLKARVQRHLEAFHALSLAGKCRYVTEKALGVSSEVMALGSRTLRRYLSKPLPSTAPTAPATPEQLVQQIADFGLQMIAKHVPRPYAGKLYIFHGAHWPAGYVERWSTMAADGISTWLLPGSHIGMMDKPYVFEVASRLRECLPASCRETAATQLSMVKTQNG